jgi:mannose-1-phosphate guanylyltransferase
MRSKLVALSASLRQGMDGRGAGGATAIDVLKEEASRTQALILAGGSAKRMGPISEPKPLLRVAGKPLIDRCIEYLRDNGLRDFILLVGHGAELLMKHVGGGERYGVKVSYCLDPQVKWVGKAKALKNALESGAVDRSRRSLITYPDDIFTDRTLAARFLLSHVEAVRRNKVLASIALASGIDLPYGVAKVDSDGIVTEFKEKPTLDVLTSTGLYIIEPPVYDLILQSIDLEAPEPLEFEATILPRLAEEGKLHAFTISRNTWFPVNTLKDLERVDDILRSEEA